MRPAHVNIADEETRFHTVPNVRRLRSTVMLAERDDPLRELVARQVIEFARRGEREPTKLKSQVMAAIRP